MSFLSIENKEVRCTCFHVPSFDLTALKKSKQPQISVSSLPSSRKTKSTLAKSTDASHVRTKRSLKREKPKTHRECRSNNHDQNFTSNDKVKMSQLSEREKYLFSVRLNEQSTCRQKQYNQLKNKEKQQKPKQRKTLRGHQQNLTHKPIPLQNIPITKAQEIQIKPPKAVFPLNNSQRASLPEEKTFQKEIYFQNEERSHHSVSFQRNGKNEKFFVSNPMDKIIILPKQTESIVDDEDDKMSEVLGWGWPRERIKSSFMVLGENKVQTLLASNTKNSSTGKNSLIEQDQFLFRSNKKQ